MGGERITKQFSEQKKQRDERSTGRDRNSSFEPEIVKKRQTVLSMSWIIKSHLYMRLLIVMMTYQGILLFNFLTIYATMSYKIREELNLESEFRDIN